MATNLSSNKKPPRTGQNIPQPQRPQLGFSPETLLSRRELAQRWNCCIHTIARRHDLQAVRFSRRLLRYRLKDIEAIEAAAVSK